MQATPGHDMTVPGPGCQDPGARTRGRGDGPPDRVASLIRHASVASACSGCRMKHPPRRT